MRIVICSIIAALGFLPAAPAIAALRVDISRGVEAPIAVAVPYLPFVSDNGDIDPTLGSRLADVIQNDLASIGFLRAVPRSPYAMAMPVADASRPRFAFWKGNSAQLLVSGTVSAAPGGLFAVECRLFDVFSEAQVASRILRGRAADWRRVAHQCANMVYENLVGEPGYFDSRIVYVAESGTKVGRVKRLAEMDYDGANHAYMTKGQQLVSTPRFADSGDRLTYMAFLGRTSKIYTLALASRETREVTLPPGMAFGPRFSPDGNALLLSIVKGTNVSIHKVNVPGGEAVELTSVAGINTGASFSPDGREIVFESNRSGSQQVYRMAADGSGQRRISFGGGSYGTPVWSPRGDMIAVTKISGGQFRIATMRTDGRDERVVTSGRHDEAPSWASNGRAIVFTRVGRNTALPELWMVDLVGNASRRVVTPQGGSDPSWSPARK